MPYSFPFPPQYYNNISSEYENKRYLPESHLLTELRSVTTGLKPKEFPAPSSTLITKDRYTSQIPGFSSQVNRARYVTLSLVPANLHIMENIFKLVFINFSVTLLLPYFCTMNFWGVLTSELRKIPKVDCCLPPATYTEHCSTLIYRSQPEDSAFVGSLLSAWLRFSTLRESPICLQAGVCNESLGARILYILFSL